MRTGEADSGWPSLLATRQSGEEEMHAAAKEFRVEKLVRVKPADLAPLPPAKLASSSATRILI